MLRGRAAPPQPTPAGVPEHPRLAAGELGAILGALKLRWVVSGEELCDLSQRGVWGSSARHLPQQKHGRGGGCGTGERKPCPRGCAGLPTIRSSGWGCWVRFPRMVLHQVRQGWPWCFRLLVA